MAQQRALAACHRQQWRALSTIKESNQDVAAEFTLRMSRGLIFGRSHEG